MGLASIAAPMYIAEVAPARSRGGLGFMYQLSIVCGCVASGAIAYFLARYVAEHLSWRVMFGSELAPVVGFVLCLFLVPESPRWLLEKDRREGGPGVLARIDGAERAAVEVKEITSSLAEEGGGFAELFRPGFRQALLVGVCLAIFNQWTG